MELHIVEISILVAIIYFMKRRVVVFSLYFQFLHKKLFSVLMGREEELVQFFGKHEEGSFGSWKQQVGWFQIWSKKRWSLT